MICPSCGTENNPGVDFCRNCRRYLEWNGEIAEPEESPAPPPGPPEEAAATQPAPRRRRYAGRRLLSEEEPESRSERAPYLVVEPEERPAPPAKPNPKVGVAVSLSPTELVVDPGQKASCEVRIANSGTVVDQFHATVEGTPSAWATIEPSVVNLYPESEPEVVELVFQPPRAPTTPTGLLRFVVRATSRTDPSVSAVSQGALRILPYHDMDAQLVPETSDGRRHAEHTFVLRNRGNARVVAPLAGKDPNELLSFNFEPQSLIADAGGEASARVHLHTRRRLWLGQPQLRPFKVTGAPEEAPLLDTEGRMRQIALIPRWLVRVAVVALPLLTLLALYLSSTARVPNVVGMSKTAALATLTRSGFAPKLNPVASDTVPADMVISTDPGPNGRRRRGTPVTVNASAGRSPVQVPNVAALDVNTATSQLLGLGLVVARVNEPNQLPAGTAIVTDPPANTKVPPGSGITLHVSTGPNGTSGPGGSSTPGGAAAGGAGGAAATPPTMVAPDALSFPGQPVSATSTPQILTITNQGPATMTVSTVALGGPNAGEFAVASDKCSGSPVAAGAICAVGITFTPAAAGPRTATLSLVSNAAGSPKTVNLAGQGVASKVRLSETTLSFGSQKVQTTSDPQTVSLTNAGAGPLTIGSVVLGGTNASDWSKTKDTCIGTTVATLATCSVTLVFHPPAQPANSLRRSTLSFTDDADGGSQQNVDLSGTSTAPEALISTPGPFKVLADTQLVTVQNVGTSQLVMATLSLGGSNAADFVLSSNTCTGAQLAPGASCAVSVKFQATHGVALTDCYAATLNIPDDAPVAASVQQVALIAPGTTQHCP